LFFTARHKIILEVINVTETAGCKIDGCKHSVKAKGYCRVHYNKWRKGDFGKARFKICKMEGCTKPRHLKAYCEEHYNSEHLKKAAEEAGE
jgi:hypothetical protein